MKRIVCFGDSNTWGYNAETEGRYDDDVRWTKLLGKLLGEDYDVIEEGLSGRVAVVDDPLFEGLNAFNYIHPCLMSHSPLHLVIIMLGTNDTKERFNLTAANIAMGIVRLAIKAKNTPVGIDGKEPKVLVIAPPPIGSEYINTEIGPPMGEKCDIKSLEIPKYLEELLKLNDIEFLDTRDKVPMNDIDYMHLTKEGHNILSKLVFDKIKSII